MKRYSLTKYLFVLVLLFLTNGLNAQITIGTGTASSEKYPFNGYYNYSWSQSIYLANEINSSGNLTSIAFYVNNAPSNYTMLNQKIYARHTSLNAVTSSSYEDITGFTLIYDGSITYNGSGWKTINLTTPFSYNGSDNLELKFENRDGTYSSGFPYFRYTSTPSGTINHRSKYDYKDAGFPTTCLYCLTDRVLPNIQMTFEPCNINTGVLSSTLSTLNPGENTILSISGQDSGTTLQWESSIDNILFTPISGAISSTLSQTLYQTKYYRVRVNNGICSKYTSTKTVTVDVSGLITKTIGTIGASNSSNSPLNNLQKYSWSNFIYKASDIGQAGNLSRVSFHVANSPTKYTFDNQKIYVRHTSASNYTTIDYPTTAGFTLVYDGPLTYEGTGWKEMVFDIPFNYNGIDNLEFLFENRAGSMTIDVASFSYEAISANGTTLRRDYGDIFPSTCNSCQRYSFRPNIKLAFIPCSITAGSISGTVTSLCNSGATTLALSGNAVGSTIQWQSSLDNVTFTDIAGATGTALSTGTITQSNYYRCEISKNGCTSTTASQLISVTTISHATIASSSTSILSGETVTMTASGLQAGATSQWYSSNDNVSFSPINGATNSSYSTSLLTNSTYFKLIQTSGECSDTSNTVYVSLTTSDLITITLDGGISETYNFPFNGVYDYSWSSVIYKSNEINTSGELKRIAFNVNNSPVNEVMQNQKIYVRHTQLGEYNDVAHPSTAGFTLVYDGAITYNGSGWNEIVFQNAFNYNGYDNLEFLFENRDGQWAYSNSPRFKGTSSYSEYRVKRGFNDDAFSTTLNANKTNWLLDIKMKFESCDVASSILTAENNNVAIGSDVILTLSNVEQGATIAWQKSIDNINFKVITGVTTTHLVDQMGIATQYYRAIVTSTCSLASEIVTITPNNCFLETATITSGTSSSENIFFNGYWEYNWSNIIYKASDINLGAGKVLSMSVDIANSPTNYTMTNQKVYIRQTNVAEFSNTTYPGTSGFTLVYEGDLTFNGAGFKEIPFSTEFVYDGVSNLEVLIENRDGGYAYGFPKYNYKTITPKQLRYANGYSGFPTNSYSPLGYLPNVRFKLVGGTPDLGSNLSGLKNTEIQLNINVTGLSSFNWRSNSNLSSLSISNPIYSINNSDIIYLEGSTVGGCSFLDSVIITSVDSIYVTDRVIGRSSSSLDVVVQKAVESANAGNDVYVLFAIEPDNSGVSLYPLNQIIQGFNFNNGSITIDRAYFSEGIQGIDFGSVYNNTEIIALFWGRARVNSRNITSINLATKSLHYFELKDKVERTYYLTNQRFNILPIYFKNYYKSASVNYKIYDNTRNIIKSGVVNIKHGDNRFVVNLASNLSSGYYIFEIENEKREKFVCKFYVERDIITSPYENERLEIKENQLILGQ